MIVKAGCNTSFCGKHSWACHMTLSDWFLSREIKGRENTSNLEKAKEHSSFYNVILFLHLNGFFGCVTFRVVCEKFNKHSFFSKMWKDLKYQSRIFHILESIALCYRMILYGKILLYKYFLLDNNLNDSFSQ